MKTRTTRLTLSHFEGVFEVEIIDEGAGEYVLVSCGLDRPPFEQSISIGPSEWPFLRDAIDRMFVEIAKNEGEGKQALPDAEAPPREQSSPIGAASGEASWIPWMVGSAHPQGWSSSRYWFVFETGQSRQRFRMGGSGTGLTMVVRMTSSPTRW